MKLRWHMAALAFIICAAEPALACVIRTRMVLEDVKHADVVVIGRVANYRIVRNEEMRRRIPSLPRLSSDGRKLYDDPNRTVLWDYAQFDIHVDEVLVGKAPKIVSVTWDNSTFGEPETMAAGPFLIALRRPNSAGPPLRGPSATIVVNPKPRLLTVLQAPCSGAFIFEAGSDKAQAVRQILHSNTP